MLEARGISKSFKNRKVLKGASIYLNRGEIAGLLGPNGAGKTTLFKIIIGLLRPDEGTILLDEKRIDGYRLHQLIQMGIGYLPQEPSVFTGLTVYENLKVIGDRIYRASCGEKVEEMLRIMGLEKIRDSPTGSLSGGEKRRLEVARTLLLEPKYILFDEPFSQIDPKTVYELIEIILKMREKGIGVLITDHSAREVFKVCNRIYIITDGEVVIEGSPENLKQNPTVKEIYLGRLFEV